MTEEELEKWADAMIEYDPHIANWPQSKVDRYKRCLIACKKTMPDDGDGQIAVQTAIDMEILEKMVEMYRNGEGVKFERLDIRHEQETFERIRREYDIQEE
jgi:hypothetical protein